uniref:HD/PDEase domain-containing protein n=1 Tax=viral metagenome TaxID=1070528 RepID=A0A6C0EF04_9ZZZZ
MIIYDNIHGHITLDTIAESIINTSIFQRLRYIHQTGLLYLEYPSANHSRFEHSIGTYHLARQMIEQLAKKHTDINITKEIIMLVSIAGLCHDLGHLLFSHLFDDYFLIKLPDYDKLKNLTKNISHEYRSIYLLNYLVTKNNINLNKFQLKVIGDLINPKEAEYSKWKPKYQLGKWIFQIISNPLNSIDVDKFDYLTRDTQAVGLKFGFDYLRIINDAKIIDNKICYSLDCSEDIYKMFFIRYRLHREIYNHKSVKSIEILVIKLLFELEKELKISEYILDAEKMLLLTDHFIWNQKKNDNIIQLIQNIDERKLPELVYQDISLNTINFDVLSLKEKFNDNSYEIIEFKVGYVGGKSTNPLNKITFYDIENNKIISENKVRDFSLLMNQKHQEYFFRIYCTNLSLINDYYKYFENIKNENNDIN